VTVLRFQEQPPKSRLSPKDKLGDGHPYTLESLHNLIKLSEASGKPEKAKEWRAKFPQTEAAGQ
jgi:hypothetical protein